MEFNNYKDLNNYINSFDFINAKLTKAKKTGYICPLCLNGTGKKGIGAKLNKDNTIHCDACGFHGDFIELLLQLNKIDKQNINDLYKLLGLEFDININDLYLKIHENFDNGNIIDLLTKKEKEIFLDSLRLFKNLNDVIEKYIEEDTRFREDLKNLYFSAGFYAYILPFNYDENFFIKLKNAINQLVNDNEKGKVYNLTYDEKYFKYLITLQKNYNKAIDKIDEYIKLGLLPNYKTIEQIIKDNPISLRLMYKYFLNSNKKGVN